MILGIDENTRFSPAENFKASAVLDSVVNGLQNPGGLKVVPPPSFTTQRLVVDGSPVIVVSIEELDISSKPCYVEPRGIENGSYKRVDDKDIKLSTTEIFELRNILKRFGTDKEPIKQATIDDLQKDSVDRYLNHLIANNSRALRGTTELTERLLRLNILTRDQHPTLASILVFGSYPQQFFPKLHIDVTVHPGLKKSLAASPVSFVDRRICEGTVSEMLDESLQAVRRNLRTHSVVSGSGRKDQLEIPLEVL